MVTLVNRAKVATATTGTGAITLGSAVDGYQTFANAGVINSDVVRYTIEDGDAWEIGAGTYSSGTLTRVLDESSTGSLLNLSGEAVVYVTAAGEDIQQPPSEGAFADGDKTKLDGLGLNDWVYLKEKWDAPPTLNATIASGAVYNYTLNGVTRYRLVPEPYLAANDAFWTSFDGTTLSGLVAARGE